ncbi:MAG: accessory gene regulator B family protein [Lachnotalea sp.]
MGYVESLTKKMIDYQIIKEADRKIYMYGLENGMAILANMITAVIIGIFSGKLSIIIIFLLSFISLRIYAGGFHLENKLTCYLFSNVILILPLYGNKFYYQFITSTNRLALFGLVVLIILFLNPVECIKRKYDVEEKMYFRKRSIFVLLFQVIIYFLLIKWKKSDYAFAILASLLIISVLLFWGKLNLRVRGVKK